MGNDGNAHRIQLTWEITHRNLNGPSFERVRRELPHRGQVDCVDSPSNHEEAKSQSLENGEQNYERHFGDGLARLLHATHGQLDALPHEQEEEDQQAAHGVEGVRGIGGNVDLFVRKCLRIRRLPLLRGIARVPRAGEDDADREEDRSPDHDGKHSGNPKHECVEESNDLAKEI